MKNLERQHLGGLANFHGNWFEHHFAVWRVARALRELELGARSRLALQLKGAWVDDWVEKRGRQVEHFQLKRKKTARWSEVAADFKSQLEAGASAVTLVVATEKRAKTLRRSKTRVPRALVLAFPPFHEPQRLVKAKSVRPALLDVCVKTNPRPTDLEFVWSVIDAAWQQARKPGRFVNSAAVVDALGDRDHLVRFAWKRTPGWVRAEKLLQRIDGFSFRLDGGHFFHDDGAGERGRLSCRTSAFTEFVRSVLKHRPQTLDEVRELL